MLPLILFCLALGVPFEDVQHRFHLNLPANWRFTPQPGDSGGATFHRDQDGVFANATVRVIPFEMAVPLDGLVNHIAAASDQEPGFRLLDRSQSRVAGYPALHRRYMVLVNGDPRLPKMVDQQILMVGSTGFVIHGEALADAFPTFEADIRQLGSSFVPGAALGKVAPPRAPLTRAALYGRWRANGHTLVLSSGGAITLDGQAGRYRLEEGALLATFGTTTKVYQVDMREQGLELSGEQFASGQVFTRDKAAGKRAGGKQPKAH